MSGVQSEKINLTSSYPRAPEVIRFGDKLVSASDYGEEQTEKLLRNRGFSEQDVLDIMLFRLECKQGHGYKKVQTRRSGDRYIDHPNGVALMLLLEFGETDVALIQAAMGHDTLEDVELSRKYYPELLKRVAGMRGDEVVHIIRCVTNPQKTGDEKRDAALKSRHYETIQDSEKSSKLKVADRCYNLRTLEVMQRPESEITERHMTTARNQIVETKAYILPLAQKLRDPYYSTLLRDVQAVERQVSDIELVRLQRATKSTVTKNIGE